MSFTHWGERQGHFVPSWTWHTAAMEKKLHKSLFGTGSSQWCTQSWAWMVNSSLGEKLAGWLGHRWLMRWQGRTTAVLQSHLWCHWRLIGWFSMNEHLAFAVSDHHMWLFLFPRHEHGPTGIICLRRLHRVSAYTDTVFMIPTYFPLVVSWKTILPAGHPSTDNSNKISILFGKERMYSFEDLHTIRSGAIKPIRALEQRQTRRLWDSWMFLWRKVELNDMLINQIGGAETSRNQRGRLEVR